jgi:hypothetical protein
LVAALGLWLRESPASALAWAEGSLALVRGSSEALSLEGPGAQLAAALACGVGFAALAVWLRPDEGEGARAAALLAPALFVAFKHGFVRQDAGVGAFFGFAVAACAVVAAQVRSARAAAASAASLVMVGAISIAATAPFGSWSAGESLQALAGLRGLHNISRAARLPNLRAQLKAEGERNLAADRLPADWVELIQQQGGTVDVVTSELALLPANGLRWAPSPWIESANVFTPEMDHRQAEHYRSDRAADFLIVELPGTEGRHPLLDMPEGFRAIRERYEVARRDSSSGPRLLLRKRRTPRLQGYGPRSELSFFSLVRGAKVPSAARDGLVLVGLRPSLRARVAALLYRVPPVEFRPLYEDGKEGWVRVLPALLAEGVPLGALPRDADELARWLDGEPAGAVRELRFSGPGVSYLGEVVSLAYMPPAAEHALK